MRAVPYLDSDTIYDGLQRCTRCLLPDSFPHIDFDDSGVCNYCHSDTLSVEKGETAFTSLLECYRDKGRDYDCIAPISGGRDSAYVLHQMVTKYDMRTLALTVDSGFITDEALNNIETITSSLGVDHVWIKNEKQMRIAGRNAAIKFQGWLRNPSIHNIVPVLNSGDKVMNLRMFRYASQQGIPLLLGGNVVGTSTYEHGNSRTGYLGIFPDNHGVYSLTDKMRLILYYGWDFLSNSYNWHPSIFEEYLTGASVYFFDQLLKPRDVEIVGFYDYLPWNEKQIVSTIKKIGWRGADDTTTTWRIDDSAYPIINYLYFYLAGIDEHVELYSKMIRAGQLTREEAYAKCRSDSRPRVPSLEKAWKELGVTEQKVNKALNKHRDKMIRQYLKGTSFEKCVSSYSPSTSPLTLEALQPEPTMLRAG